MRLRWKLFQTHNSMIPVGDRPIRLKVSISISFHTREAMVKWLEQSIAELEDLGSIPALSKCSLCVQGDSKRTENLPIQSYLVSAFTSAAWLGSYQA